MATLSNVQGSKKPEDMSRKVGRVITLVAFGLPLLALAILGFSIGNGYTAGGFVSLWLGVFVFASLRFRRKKTFMVVERFGYFWDVKFAGPRILIPWIDNPILADDFLQKQVKLFQGAKEPISIDFIGGSAPIDASGWYQIANPGDTESGNLKEVREQVLKYTYRVKVDERASRVAEIFQGAFRTFLEQRTIPDAQKEMEGLAAQGADAAREALAEIGVYAFPKKGIIVRDIDLPPVLIELRERETRGIADAQEAINRSRSYWEPLVEMKKGMAKASAGALKMSDKDIKHLFLAQKGFETLQKTGSNVSLVAGDIDGVLKTITVGSVTTQKGGAP